MSSRRRGLLLMFVSAAVFSAMSMLVKLASRTGTSAYLISLVRFLFGLAVAGGIICLGPVGRRPIWNMPWLVVRGLTGGFAVIVYFLSIEWLGVARGTLFNYTFPAFAAAFSWPLLGERLSSRTWLAVASSILGAGLLAYGRPDAAAGGRPGGMEVIYSLIAILGGAAAGVAVCAIRLCRRTESTYVIYSSQCLFGAAFVLAVMGVRPTSCGAGSASPLMMWGLLFGIAGLAMLAQTMMTYAYKMVAAVEGGLMSLLTPCLNLGLGVFLFGEALRATALAGAALVLGSCLFVALGEGDAEGPAPGGGAN